MNAHVVVVDTVPALILHPQRRAASSAPPPPLPGPGTVPRPRLLRRLLAATDARVALLVAPAGYGKTTLLAEWALRDERPFAYVALGAGHDDLLARLTAERPAVPGGHVVVADDAQRLPADALGRLIDAAVTWPRGRTLVIVSRCAPSGPIGRLRAHRRLVEITADDLAMTPLEAAMLVAATGLELGPQQLDALLGRARGWPAALYLAARSIGQAPDPNAALKGLSGGEPMIASFFRDDVLASLTPGQRAFARRAAVLDRVSASACDAVLGARGSGPVLEELARHGLPLTALDACELTFELHPLLAGMLRAERARTEPELEPELRRRAALWHARHHELDAALPHALAADDPHLAGRLLWAMTLPAAAGRRSDSLEPWLSRFDERTVASEPTLALTAATHHLLAGRRAAAERALDAAERALPHPTRGDPAPDVAAPTSHDPREDVLAAVLLRACIARDGLADMAAHAARARAELAPWSPWQALALLLTGVAAHLAGDDTSVAAVLEEAADRAGDRLPLVAALAHAQLALVDADREAWDDAAVHAQEAHAALTPGVSGPVRALVLAAGAVVAAQRGDVAQARHDAADAQRLLAPRRDFVPWVLAEAEIWLARAEILLSDGPGARGGLARAAHLQPRVPGDRTLERWIHDGWARADAFAETATGDGPMLTNAELRVLRLLPSHMSFREIGQRLHVSTNTVKTQALAVYRKLDVTCRSDAVARGRSAGLIGEA